MNRFLEHLIAYLQWFIVTAVGFPVGILAGSTVLASLGVSVESGLLVLIGSLLTGILVAIGQMLIVRSARHSTWILFTSIGVAAGSWISTQVIGMSSSPLAAFMGGLLGGMTPGVLQLGLIDARIWKRGEWLLLSGVGWGLAALLGSLFLTNASAGGSLLALEASQYIALVGWSTTSLFAVLLLLLFTPIARQRDLSGRITWLP